MSVSLSDSGSESEEDYDYSVFKDGTVAATADLTLAAMQINPNSPMEQKLAQQALDKLKRFPRFAESLVYVSLHGPTSPVSIGNSVVVRFEYSHKTPTVHVKQYTPLSTVMEQYTRRHDMIMMKNSKLPLERVHSVVESGMRKCHSDHPQNISDNPGAVDSKLWSDAEMAVLHSTPLQSNDVSKLQEVGVKIQNRLRDELSVERTMDDILANLRLHRLYQHLQNFDSVSLCPSERVHDPSDWIALVKIGSRGSSNSGKDVIVDKMSVPVPNAGELEFGKAPLKVGIFEFRYHLVGCSTPACVSAPFECVMPRCSISVSSSVIACGGLFSLSYSIELSRLHNPQDYISVHKVGKSYGPSGCVLKVQVNPENSGVIHINSLTFPGAFVAKYHLAQLGGAIAAVSEVFEARVQDKSLDLNPREIRIFLCSTVCDMEAERDEVIRNIIPSLQASLEHRMITITLIAPSEGIDEGRKASLSSPEGSTADLHIILRELDRCYPFYIFILGERYGSIPASFDEALLLKYPWLNVERSSDMLPGVRASVIELLIVNGFLVQPDGAKHCIFFFRDSGFAKRSGKDRSVFNLYEPVSEYYREALCNLKDQIREKPDSKICEYGDVNKFSRLLRSHLEAAIESEYPSLKSYTRQERVELASDSILSQILKELEPFPSAHEDVEIEVDSLFMPPKPIIVTGRRGCGKTTFITKLIQKYVEVVAKQDDVVMAPDQSVGWSPSACSSITSFTKGGKQYLVLVQHIGLENTVSNQLQILENAMAITNKIFNLNFSMQWNEKELIQQMWPWLENVCSKGEFIWVLDGIEHVPSKSSIEIHCVHSKEETTAVRTQTVSRLKDDSQLLHDEIDDGISMARIKAQARLRRWLIPLLDESSPFHARTRFPNLRLLVSCSLPMGRTSEADPLNKINSDIQTLVEDKKEGLRVINIPAWTPEQKKRYIKNVLESRTLPQVAQEFLIALSKEDDVVDAKMIFTDPLSSPILATCLVQEVTDLCRDVNKDEASITLQLNTLRACSSLDQVCRLALQWRMRSPTTETALKFLFVSRYGLREMELLGLLKERDKISDEELLRILHVLKPITIKVVGFLVLKPHYRHVLNRMLDANELKQVYAKKMATFFEELNNEHRQTQELPLLLLRIGKLEGLLEYVTNPHIFSVIGKAEAFRYFKAAGFPHEVVASTLKSRFETEFQMNGAGGNQYDLSKLEKYGYNKEHEIHEAGGITTAKGALAMAGDRSSGLRAARIERYVERFCSVGLDIVDVICCLDARNLEVAEAILEGLLKMLHSADSLMLVSERSSKYPAWSQKCLASYATVFERALNALDSSEAIPNPRTEDMRLHQIRIMHDLINSKVKLLIKVAAGVAEDEDVLKQEGPQKLPTKDLGLKRQPSSKRFKIVRGSESSNVIIRFEKLLEKSSRQSFSKR